jgi:hypothetical protein
MIMKKAQMQVKKQLKDSAKRIKITDIAVGDGIDTAEQVK